MKTQIVQPQWVSIKIENRIKIAEMFGLVKDQGSIVEDGHVVSDGYSHAELSKITVDGLQEATGSKNKDIVELLQLLITQLEVEEDEIKVQSPEPVITPEVKPITKITQKRNGKKNK